MGWQDRDYARHGAPARPVWSHGPAGAGAGAGRNIVTTLIIINAVIYVLGSVSPTCGDLFFGIGAMQARAVAHGQLWRLITAQYLHAGTWHLLFNMLALHFLGRPLERMWSSRRFFIIYTLCGLFGNVFYTVLGVRGVIDPQMPAVGASGSIYGLLGIVAVLFPTATVYVYFLFPIRIRTAAFIFGGIALLSVLERAEGTNFGGEACHLAGLVFGVWWAMKGDVWWATRGRFWWTRAKARAPSMPRPSRARKPRGFEAKVAQRRDDEETIDRILKKVYEGGIHTLTDSEKRALQEATERQRQREQDAGRVDRL
jgi:membrane associated rhomboid family serine protease